MYKVGRSKTAPLTKEEVKTIETASPEELSQRLETEIQALQQLVQTLRPKAVEEELARLESRIRAINDAIRTATGNQLTALQSELNQVFADYAQVQGSVRDSLENSIKERQALVLQEQIRLLQEKIRLLPKPVAAPAVSTPDAGKKAQLKYVQDQIQLLQLRVIREQAKAIQRNINQLQAQ